MSELTKEDLQMWRLRIKDAPNVYNPERDMLDTIAARDSELAETIVALRALTLALSGSYQFWELEQARVVLTRHKESK